MRRGEAPEETYAEPGAAVSVSSAGWLNGAWAANLRRSFAVSHGAPDTKGAPRHINYHNEQSSRQNGQR